LMVPGTAMMTGRISHGGMIIDLRSYIIMRPVRAATQKCVGF